MNDKLTTPPKGQTRPRIVIRALRAWNKELEDEDRQTKYCKMASAPLVFYRGTNRLFWADFANDKRLRDFGNAETRTWLQGDLHAYNYGSYGNAKGDVSTAGAGGPAGWGRARRRARRGGRRHRRRLEWSQERCRGGRCDGRDASQRPEAP